MNRWNHYPMFTNRPDTRNPGRLNEFNEIQRNLGARIAYLLRFHGEERIAHVYTATEDDNIERASYRTIQLPSELLLDGSRLIVGQLASTKLGRFDIPDSYALDKMDGDTLISSVAVLGPSYHKRIRNPVRSARGVTLDLDLLREANDVLTVLEGDYLGARPQNQPPIEVSDFPAIYVNPEFGSILSTNDAA